MIQESDLKSFLLETTVFIHCTSKLAFVFWSRFRDSQLLPFYTFSIIILTFPPSTPNWHLRYIGSYFNLIPAHHHGYGLEHIFQLQCYGNGSFTYAIEFHNPFKVRNLLFSLSLFLFVILGLNCSSYDIPFNEGKFHNYIMVQSKVKIR